MLKEVIEGCLEDVDSSYKKKTANSWLTQKCLAKAVWPSGDMKRPHRYTPVFGKSELSSSRS